MTTAAATLPVDSDRPAPSQVVDLQCMEIWGGHRATDAAVSVAGLDAWVLAKPYDNNETGGDIYYLSTCGSGRVSRMILADVAGHGDSVDAVARDLRELMRKYISKPNQTDFAQALNREFGELTDDGAFATALLATYFEPTEQFIVCNAGHPIPLWYHAESDHWEPLRHDSQSASTEPANLSLLRCGRFRSPAASFGRGCASLGGAHGVVDGRWDGAGVVGRRIGAT